MSGHDLNTQYTHLFTDTHADIHTQTYTHSYTHKLRAIYRENDQLKLPMGSRLGSEREHVHLDSFVTPLRMAHESYKSVHCTSNL